MGFVCLGYFITLGYVSLIKRRSPEKGLKCRPTFDTYGY